MGFHFLTKFMIVLLVLFLPQVLKKRWSDTRCIKQMRPPVLVFVVDDVVAVCLLRNSLSKVVVVSWSSLKPQKCSLHSK